MKSNMEQALLLILAILLNGSNGKPTTDSVGEKLMNCSTCKSPTFHGRDFYLPFCKGNQTYGNLCEAICDDALDGLPSKGSCDLCETKKCNQVFSPVCTLDGRRLFANKCQAQCAGQESSDCPGLNVVIPGKTPLPPNKELPLRLQNVDANDAETSEYLK